MWNISFLTLPIIFLNRRFYFIWISFFFSELLNLWIEYKKSWNYESCNWCKWSRVLRRNFFEFFARCTMSIIIDYQTRENWSKRFHHFDDPFSQIHITTSLYEMYSAHVPCLTLNMLHEIIKHSFNAKSTSSSRLCALLSLFYTYEKTFGEVVGQVMKFGGCSGSRRR